MCAAFLANRADERVLMRSSPGALSLCLAAAFSAGAVAAGELPAGRTGKPALAKSSCAAYGLGFVPIAGSDTCVRVSGHVRMEYTFGRAGTQPGHPLETGASAYVPQEAPPAAPDSGLVFGRLKPAALNVPPAAAKPRGNTTGLNRTAP